MQDTVLQKILKNKKIWIKKKQKEFPLSSFKNKIFITNKNFYQSLKQVHPAYIFEFKKHSPTLGCIRKNFDLQKISSIYKQYASVVSVLTDEQFFHGSFQYIPIIRSYLDQPILCKDFFIDPYQIYLARYFQADAILLMLSVLNDQHYTMLSKIAKSLNMGILTEIHNEKELNRAINLKSELIGINNRNLNDLSVDINLTNKIAIKIPKSTLIISESGINNYHQIRKISPLVNGFLIGSHLMKSDDLEFAIKSLILGNNKICGLTRDQDAKLAFSLGAIYGGLIFCNNSLRKINVNIAKNIINGNDLKYIGVFCNNSVNQVAKITNSLSLFGIQLHGNENPEYINKLSQKVSKKIKIWKSFGIHTSLPKTNWKQVDKYIFDNKDGGGTGKTFNWSLLDNQCLKNIILSGGLNIKNCFLASRLGCFGLDFNSGIEISPGIKDFKKMKIIFKILRQYKQLSEF